MNGLPEDAIRLAISALIVVLIEVGAIGGGIMATAPKTAITEATVMEPELISDDTTPVQSRPRRRRGRYQKNVAVVRFVARYCQRHGRIPTHPELRAAFPGISKAAAQRYRVAA